MFIIGTLDSCITLTGKWVDYFGSTIITWSRDFDNPQYLQFWMDFWEQWFGMQGYDSEKFTYMNGLHLDSKYMCLDSRYISSSSLILIWVILLFTFLKEFQNPNFKGPTKSKIKKAYFKTF